MIAPDPKDSQDPPIRDLSYEQAIAELDRIVTALEGGSQSLDTSLELFERGQVITRHCTNLLDQAELRIRTISGEELVDFDPS
jgi:exodeoxyribonuclease VII small subunit